MCVCASCCPFRCVFTKRCFTCTVASRCVLHLTEPFSLTPFRLPLYVSLCVEHRLCELRAARGCALVRATGRPFRVRDCFLDDILAASPCAPATRNAEQLGMGYVQHAAEDGRKTSRYDFWKEIPTSGRKMLLPCESLRGQGWKGPVRETASDACRYSGCWHEHSKDGEAVPRFSNRTGIRPYAFGAMVATFSRSVRLEDEGALLAAIATGNANGPR